MFGIPFLTASLLVKAGCVLAIIGAVAFAGWSVVHSIQVGAVKEIKAADAVAEARRATVAAAVTTVLARVDARSANAAADHKVALARQAATVKQRRPVHVPAPTVPPDHPGCVAYGLVRQHDAAALGVDPDTLQLPSGATDGACSPITNADLADAIGDNYAAARANAQELSDLQANATAKVDATAPPT